MKTRRGPLPEAQEGAVGFASWYGPGFHGKKTASGERYDMNKMTAAHKSLPLGTWVRVHKLDSNAYVDVRINDRGPFVKGRIIDLSRKAAVKLGLFNEGVSKVQLEVLKSQEALAPNAFSMNENRNEYFLQVGSFSDYANARNLANTLEKEYSSLNVLIKTAKNLAKVWVGPIDSSEKAYEQKKRLNNAGYSSLILHNPIK